MIGLGVVRGLATKPRSGRLVQIGEVLGLPTRIELPPFLSRFELLNLASEREREMVEERLNRLGNRPGRLELLEIIRSIGVGRIVEQQHDPPVRVRLHGGRQESLLDGARLLLVGRYEDRCRGGGVLQEAGLNFFARGRSVR